MPKMPRKTDRSRINKLVNELGSIREQIKKLSEREDSIKRKILDAKIHKWETDKFIVDIRSYNTTRIDYPGLVEHLRVSDMLVKRFSKLSRVVSAHIRRK